ncbi:hypothetical protein V499_00835, partial [Pseudogymnoascus sp. VKM F-103]
MWGGATTRSQLRESINSLYTRYKVPEAPTENPVNLETDPTRRLIFFREKEIVNSLAFVSVTSDDSRKVMAVCIEEHINRKGITIRIASNTGDLKAVTAGFKRIGGILEQVARRPKTKKTDNIEILLREVIILDIDRILSRLRSRHVSTSKTAGKPALITQLHDAINHKSVKSTASLTTRSQNLQDLFTELEAISDIKASTALIHRLLYDIVTQAHALTSTTNLDVLLRDSKLEPPSLKSHIPIALRKLSHYYSAARFLVSAARDKECHVFRTVLVEPFHIDMPPSLYEADIKVHAEIQLLFFYELHPHLPRPRIICSSKSACYLCNLFFSLHGVFHIRRSHGRLYEKWTLPDWLPIPEPRRAELGVLVTQLDGALKAKIQKGCDKHDYPTESVLSIARQWTPSTSSKTSSSLASISTIRPQPTLHKEGSQDGVLSQLSSMPPTPPRTPPSRIPSISGAQNRAREHRIELPTTTHPVTITPAQLPYSQLITPTTPPLLLHLNNPRLTLDFDFRLASPCRLVLTHVDDITAPVVDEEYRTVDIEEIPTEAEMQVSRLRGKE